jgi:hypothetical protein
MVRRAIPESTNNNLEAEEVRLLEEILAEVRKFQASPASTSSEQSKSLPSQLTGLAKSAVSGEDGEFLDGLWAMLEELPGELMELAPSLLAML